MSQPSLPVNQQQPDPNEPFDIRTVVLMLVAALIGLVIGTLTFLAGQPAAAAAVAGLIAAGASLVAAHGLIRRR